MADKKLTKSRDKKIAGVCGGIAEYFGIDPTAVRLVWALAILVYGAGILLYIILAIIMPEPAGGTTMKNEPEADDDEIVVEVADVDEDSEEKK